MRMHKVSRGLVERNSTYTHNDLNSIINMRRVVDLHSIFAMDTQIFIFSLRALLTWRQEKERNNRSPIDALFFHRSDSQHAFLNVYGRKEKVKNSEGTDTKDNYRPPPLEYMRNSALHNFTSLEFEAPRSIDSRWEFNRCPHIYFIKTSS